MKSILGKFSVLAAALMISALPALANEGAMDKVMGEGVRTEKNECLLVAKNCANQVDTIQERIERIKGEISRGTDVYTNDELNRLHRQLEEAIRFLEYETTSS